MDVGHFQRGCLVVGLLFVGVQLQLSESVEVRTDFGTPQDLAARCFDGTVTQMDRQTD